MEEMIVPVLFKKNITFVMTFGSRLLVLIAGMCDMVDQNFKDSANKSQVQAFKGWMKRFIVTNYEIFLDFFKHHSEFVGQKYLNKGPSMLAKMAPILVGQSMMMQQSQQQSLMNKASIIGKLTNNDQVQMWSIFEYVRAFSYVGQIAVERIPLEEKNKQD